MKIIRNTNYSNSSLLYRIFAFLCFPAMAFIILNMVLAAFEIYGKTWIRELDIILRNGLPFFLFLTGSFIRNQKLRIPLLICFPVFLIGYTLKTLDHYGIVDMNTKWIIAPALFGLLLTYSIHFFVKKEKTVLGYLKILWFMMISYVMLSVYFPIGFHFYGFGVIELFEATTYLMFLLMGLGLYEYFRKGKEENNF